jgi:hypothetical protein
VAVASIVPAHVDDQFLDLLLIDVLKQTLQERLQRLCGILDHQIELKIDCLGVRHSLEPIVLPAILQV